MTTEARERLESDVALAMSLCDYEVHDVDGYIDIARAAVTTVLTHDALAALVDWPELLAAGERVGALHTYTDTHGQASEDEWDEVWVLADQPNGADAG